MRQGGSRLLRGGWARPLFLAALCALAAAPARGQASQFERFEQLARRAEQVLDANPAEAVQLYREALKIRPAWVDGWLYMGAALYQLERYAEATHALRKGIELAPKIGTAWALLGLCEAELDNAEQALADIARGEQLGLGPNLAFEVAVRVKAARLLIARGSFDEAMGKMYPLSKRKVDHPAIEEIMGLTALAVYQDPSALTPEQQEMVKLAGRAAWAGGTGRPADALAGYDELVRRFPKSPGVHYARALYLMESDPKAALEEFRQEVENTPDHWPALLMLANLEIRQGQPDEALKHLERALELVPVSYRWICHASIGQAHLTAGRVEQAIAKLEKATRLVSGNAQIHYYLSQAYRRAGRKEDAARELAEFQRLKEIEDPLALPAFQPGARRQ
ncbi:MAG: tetratricopeptide repeat protein [Bryobacteraceae bacterium]|nr:tetratricopeptide repeat protein [Bryobacteraceae bacterium]